MGVMRALHATLLHTASILALRVLVTLGVGALGFRALSDDDFARVTLAQQFAEAPRLDPTGTSWLPFPFWIHGVAHALFGPDLAVARVTTVVVACAASLLLYGCARMSGVPSRAAWLGVVLWSFVPVGVFAGAATVPELATAALCASSLLLTRRSDARALMLAAGLVVPATLSRYEAWPVAVFVMASIGIPGRGQAGNGVPSAPWSTRAAAIVLAGLGPIAWVAWNQYAHGDPLHFHSRVSAYWNAWGDEASHSLVALANYPKAVILEAPVLAASIAGALYHVRRSWVRGPWHRCWLRPALGAAFVVVSLTLAQATGGAPTHHPERTLLLVWALGWIAAADALTGRFAPQGAGWNLWRRVWIASAIVFMLIRTHSVSSWYGVRRGDEVQVGRWLREHAPGKVLLAPKDYGYFAVMAASATPDRIDLVGSVDPRDAKKPSAFGSEASLREFAQRRGARWLVASGEHASVARRLGHERSVMGEWSVVEIPTALELSR